MITANPFANWANMLAKLPNPPISPATVQRASMDAELADLPNMTDRIRHVIKREGVATAGWIATECGLQGGAAKVHALLSRDIERGRILFADGMFEWNEAWDEEQAKRLAEAAQLLRRHGYTVTEPQQRAST